MGHLKTLVSPAQRAISAAVKEATRRVVRAMIKGIWALKANREAALRAIGKYTRSTDRNLLEETYQTNRKVIQLKRSAHRRGGSKCP